MQFLSFIAAVAAVSAAADRMLHADLPRESLPDPGRSPAQQDTTQGGLCNWDARALQALLRAEKTPVRPNEPYPPLLGAPNPLSPSARRASSQLRSLRHANVSALSARPLHSCGGH